MILLNNHIDYLEKSVKMRYGSISDVIYQKPLPDIKLPDKEDGMSNTVYKKLLNVAVDEIQKRKDVLPKALGFILSTIDDSFGIYIKRNSVTQRAYQENDIVTIMKHLDIWYAQKLGSTSSNVKTSNPDEIDQAERNWDKLHQLKHQSIEEFYKIFEANFKVYTHKTGTKVSDKNKAYKFLKKLDLKRHGEWIKRMAKEEKQFNMKLKLNPELQRDTMAGYPQTFEEAYQLAIIEEMSKDEPSDGSTSNEDVQLTNDEAESEITIPINESKSYAKVKGKDPSNQSKKKWPPGTKPSQINFKPCNNPAHKPGEDRDHMGWECPHKHTKPEPKPLEIDYEQLAKHLAPLLNQNKVCYTNTNTDWSQPKSYTL